MMKKRTVLSLAFLITVVLSFLAGRGFQHMTAGYYYTVIDKESHPLEHGEIELIHACESFGIPFMTPETSIIRYSPSSIIGLSMILYKTQSGFQESSPHVRSVMVASNTASWTDNFNSYRLEIKPIQKAKHNGQ